MKTHEVYRIASELIYHLNHYDLTPEEVNTILNEIESNLRLSSDRTIVKIKDVDEIKLEDDVANFRAAAKELDARLQMCRNCGQWEGCRGTSSSCYKMI